MNRNLVDSTKNLLKNIFSKAASTETEHIGAIKYNEQDYLILNPDVKELVASGHYKSGKEHFLRHGHKEGRETYIVKNFAEEYIAEQEVDLNSEGGFRAERFPYAGPYPWLDGPDYREQIDQKLSSGEIDKEQAELCEYWAENGYVVLENVVDHKLLDRVWKNYDKALENGTVETLKKKKADENDFPQRTPNPHLSINPICGLMNHDKITKTIELLIGRQPTPFQSIASHRGSEQAEHSDSIHMTTYPLGYLTAAWLAFEDIHPDSGPLVYYPKSHKLPYLFSSDVGISMEDFEANGYKEYSDKYEPKIKEILEENNFEQKYFHANKGDVLIWHANLIHGGSPRQDRKHSRKAMVFHYFVKGVFAYHDLAGGKAKQVGSTCLIKERAEAN